MRLRSSPSAMEMVPSLDPVTERQWAQVFWRRISTEPSPKCHPPLPLPPTKNTSKIQLLEEQPGVDKLFYSQVCKENNSGVGQEGRRSNLIETYTLGGRPRRGGGWCHGLGDSPGGVRDLICTPARGLTPGRWVPLAGWGFFFLIFYFY